MRRYLGRGRWPAEPGTVEADILCAEVHLKCQVWGESKGLEAAVVAAALAHAGVILGFVDLGVHRSRAGVTRSALLWACHAAVAHRDPAADPWEMRDPAEGMAAEALAAAVLILEGAP